MATRTRLKKKTHVATTGWQPCLLTYYQPSKGGINGTVGGGACGIRIDDSTWGCAAPPQYPCGTNIQFLIGGKVWDVPVIDRGGAIVGSHFDLNYAVAQKTGFLNTGKGTAQFRVAAKGSSGAGSGSGAPAAAAAAPTGSGGADGSLSDYVALRDLPRQAPGNPTLAESLKWWFSQFNDAAGKVFAPPAAGSSGGSTPGMSTTILGAGKAAYSKLQLGRLDQGVDFSGSGPVGAIADGTVVRIGKWPGWPGTGGIVYHTKYGNIYVMEHFTANAGLRVGQKLKAGQVIGNAPGGYPFIETGFANASGDAPLTQYNGAPDGTPMPGAYRFKKLLGL